MAFLNDIINREKKIDKKSMDEVVSGTSKIMREIFKGEKVTIYDLSINVFALAELTSQAFRLKCCDPRDYRHVERTLGVYNYVSGMLAECGGALNHELINKYGKAAEGLSQKLVEIAITGTRTDKEASKIIFDMIENMEKESDGKRE